MPKNPTQLELRRNPGLKETIRLLRAGNTEGTTFNILVFTFNMSQPRALHLVNKAKTYI
jgi:hypothetical protein